jgi:hypothetical protein
MKNPMKTKIAQAPARKCISLTEDEFEKKYLPRDNPFNPGTDLFELSGKRKSSSTLKIHNAFGLWPRTAKETVPSLWTMDWETSVRSVRLDYSNEARPILF